VNAASRATPRIPSATRSSAAVSRPSLSTSTPMSLLGFISGGCRGADSGGSGSCAAGGLAFFFFFFADCCAGGAFVSQGALGGSRGSSGGPCCPKAGSAAATTNEHKPLFTPTCYSRYRGWEARGRCSFFPQMRLQAAPMPQRSFQPDFLFSAGRVLSGAALNVREGTVVSTGAPEAGFEPVPLRGRAVLPGMVTAHSHAFQRAIRGRTEHRAHPVDDFWSWREAMYAAAERLGPDDLYAVSKFCFLEMARAGITAVGEFHYLHRDPQGKPYADPNQLDLAVARAAREAGLRVVLLRVAYARSGFGIPENPRQRRFIEGSVEEYLSNLEALAKHVPVGAAPHSVRACPEPWIREIASHARRRGWVLHLHVSEQPAEVEQCRAEHGTTPPLLL